MTDTLTTTGHHAMFDSWLDRLALGAGDRRVRVVFPEGGDPRVQEAARHLAPLGITPVLVHEDVTPDPGPGIVTTSVAELSCGPARERIARLGRERSWERTARVRRERNPLYLAAAMLDTGEADACVAGSVHPSREVIRAGLRLVGLAPGTGTLSSSFLMVPGSGNPLAFADCAVVPEPDDQQLADIAISAAETFETLTGRAASVAMLSFSTKGSADHHTVDRVRAATALVRERAPDLVIDGEIQFDAALVESVGLRKAAGSPVAGRANVFVFPNLSAGNIGYKIAERLGGVQAFGPILQGLRAPMNDLSRGCGVGDIVNLALISAMQARLVPSRRTAGFSPAEQAARSAHPPVPYDNR